LTGTLSAKPLSGPEEFVEFKADSFRISSPAEHKLRGIPLPLELQIFHKAGNDGGHTLIRDVAALSFIFREGRENKFLQALIETKKVDLTTLFAKDTIKNYVAYEGSLTTPPCTENVTWFVFGESLEASKA
jgi:carbonic anhydrase